MTKPSSRQLSVLRAVVADGGEGVAIADGRAAEECCDEQWLQREDSGYAVTLAGRQIVEAADQAAA
jgi:hypothetical protein